MAEADLVAGRLWRSIGPFKMSYVELMNIANQTLRYFKGDVDAAYEFLDRTLDPELTYGENLRLVEEKLGAKLRREVESELERFIEEKKAWIREEAEALNIAEEIRREAEERVRREVEGKIGKLTREDIEALKKRLMEECRRMISEAALPVEVWERNMARIAGEIDSSIEMFKELPREEAERRIRERVKGIVESIIGEAKRVKLLPEVPERCPIDGTLIREVTKIPVGPVPIRLPPEEEEMRARLGLPIPERAVVWLDVPPTMKLYKCMEDHIFERDPATGRLIQRTPEYIYRKILRETAAARGVAPRIPGRIPLRPELPGLRTQEAWWMWLERVKKIDRWRFLELSEEERKKLRDEWVRWMMGR